MCILSRMLLRLNCVVKRCSLKANQKRMRVDPHAENHNGYPLVVKHSHLSSLKVKRHRVNPSVKEVLQLVHPMSK